MRAIRIHEYGQNQVMQLEDDVPDPLVGPDTVLIRAKAVSVNPVDWKIVRGYLHSAYPSHFPLVPGWDVAGVVEKVGPSVVEFAPGDEVLAYNRQDHIQNGTLAELVAAPVRAVGHKSKDIDWHVAASLPLVGSTAYQCVEAAGVTAGDTVLVHNASGGVGSVAVQLATRRGARVIGTGSTKNHEWIRSIGAEPVEYGDGLETAVRHMAPAGIDVALDFIGGDALDVSRKLGSGRIVSIVDAQKVLQLGGSSVFFPPDSAQLTELSALAGAGEIDVRIGAVFPFEKSADAFGASEEGNVAGKVVIEIG